MKAYDTAPRLVCDLPPHPLHQRAKKGGPNTLRRAPTDEAHAHHGRVFLCKLFRLCALFRTFLPLHFSLSVAAN